MNLESYDFSHESVQIIDVPCNQFGNQTPGFDDEIHEFCQMHYNTTYEQCKKAEVNGQNELPLFTFLKEKKTFEGFGEGKMADVLRSFLPNIDPNYENNSNIKWNFTKFVVDKKGNVVARFEPTHDINKLGDLIELWKQTNIKNLL